MIFQKEIISRYQQGKTLWDWQQLLLIPFVIALVTVGFSWGQNTQNEWLAKDQQQQTTLETYMDRMSDLLLNNSSTTKLLHDSKKLDEVRKVATVRSLIALSRLDPERKKDVVLFLYQADLITWHKWLKTPGFDFPILNLTGADLRGADLSQVFLNNAYLPGVSLNDAHLSKTILSIAELARSYLNGADLSGSYLTGTDLNDADLSGANLSDAHLQTYQSRLPPNASRVTDLNTTTALVWRESARRIF